MHIEEDQAQAERCDRRPGRALVDAGEVCDRIRSAMAAKTDPGFVAATRTDALAVEGLAAISAKISESGATPLFAGGREA